MTPTPRDVRRAFWRDGDLEWLLHSGQAAVLVAFAAATSRLYVLECSRRWGKSWLACVLCVMFAVQRPNAQVRYAAPTGKMVRKIILPLMREILEDCPEDMAPSWNVQEGVFRFPNGSEIHVAGCDNGGADSLRGVSTDLAVVDEAGFISDLGYLVQSVLMPQLLTVDGRLFLASTPAVSPDHEWSDYCDQAEQSGAYSHATIYDAPHISAEQREEFFAIAGGENSVSARREYLAERIVDTAHAVVPEFASVEHSIVHVCERPSHYFWWTSGDIGFIDLAVFAFGYVDFKRAKLVVVGEVAMQRAKSTDINVAVARKERELFPGSAPRERVIDAAAITIADMDERVNLETGERARPDEHGAHIVEMRWRLAQKDDAAAALNELRVALAELRVELDPSCTVIRSHLRNGVWNKSRNSFERVERDGVRHHFDGIDAMKYLVRHVDMRANPFPFLPPGVTQDTHHIPPRREAPVASLFRRP